MKRFLPLLLVLVAALASCQKKGLSKTEAQQTADRLLDEHMAAMKDSLTTEWRDSVLVNGPDSMKFTYFVYGDKPSGGRSLYISMHGGGGAPAAVNDKQWENQKRLWKPAEGVYFVPRAPSNTWNLWHQEYMDGFVDKVIAGGVLFEDVDPNKVYIMGYSAGGDGTFQLAPRLADHWAAATMMAGHPGDAQIMSLRNLPFSIYMGGLDSAFNRNGFAREWKANLDRLEKEDPGGFVHDVHIFDDLGHWMERRDTISLPWMASFTRNPLPEKVVWVQDDICRNRFYWLEVPSGGARQNDQVIAQYGEGKVDILRADPQVIIVGLNDNMTDLDKPVCIVKGDKVIFRGKVPRTAENIAESIRGRNDRDYIFPVRLRIEGDNVTVL